MNKKRQIISGLKDFFKHNDSSKAVNAVSNVMDKLVIQANGAPDIIKRLEKTKATKRNRSIGYTCASIKARYAGMDVQLFFYKKGNGSWNALITTDMGIDAKRTFELYARRWCIEVAHKEMKGLLNLGKCQCVDFAGQIAALSLCMIQYNILGTVKRFESYETIGGLNHLRNLRKYQVPYFRTLHRQPCQWPCNGEVWLHKSSSLER